MDRRMMRLAVALIERGQSDPGCEVVAVVGPRWGRSGGEAFVRRFYLRTARGGGDRAWICLDGRGGYAVRRAPAPEEYAPGYGFRGTLAEVRGKARAFASLPILSLIGFGLEMDCEDAGRWQEWAHLLREIGYGDLALDMGEAMGKSAEPRTAKYRRIMRAFLDLWMPRNADDKIDAATLRWRTEHTLGIRIGGDRHRMNACALEVLAESGMVRDAEGWWRVPAGGQDPARSLLTA